MAQRRMAATALAMRLYELDHGQRPESLGELVPRYLPAVPEDPFVENGQTIRYSIEADGPVLRSGDLSFRLYLSRPKAPTTSSP
jgi:hypothetical protein